MSKPDCPKCKSDDVNDDDGNYHCWSCHHEWSDPPGPKLAGRDRIVRILEDGWQVYRPVAGGPAYIRIDDRDDEPIERALLDAMVLEGTLVAGPGGITHRGSGGGIRTAAATIYDLARGPEAEIVLRFKSKAEKDYFVSQFLDGWGENLVQAAWEGKADEASRFDVVITDGFRPERRKSY